MEQRSVLITGCSTGIGYVTAKLLARRGYRVFAAARKQADVERLNAEGFDGVTLDLADGESIGRAIDDVLERSGGRLYALFNNGAYGQPGAVEDLTTDVLRAQFEVNFFGWHELTRRVIPVMREHAEGRIIQVGSILGITPLKFRGAYNASKFAMEGLTDTLRMELAGTGIHVSLIEPGRIVSAFRDNSLPTFLDNIDVERSVHKCVYERVLHKLKKPGKEPPFTLPPEAVAKKVVHALESRRPKIRYYVTVPTYILVMLNRLLPARLMDKVLIKVAGSEYRSTPE
jgi:NAD(P)-dependent dehydrogenase (short-subunit alcohol dehydrogenase family)